MSLIRMAIIAGKRDRNALKAFFSSIPHIYKIDVLNETDLERFEEILMQLQPDIILYSENDQKIALRLLSTLKAICLKTEVVFLSENEDQEFIKGVLKAGADSFLSTMHMGCLARLLEVILYSNIVVLPKSIRNCLQKPCAEEIQKSPETWN